MRFGNLVKLRALFIGLLLAVCVTSSHAQNCSGSAASAAVCGNANASTGLPSWATQTALLDRAFGTTSGTILNRGGSVWAETARPTLGANGGTGGAITLNGATSGSVTIGAKAAAGTSTVFNLPVTNGSLNQVLITDGSGNTSWTTAGAGTVSSVGLSMPGIFTVSGSPVTGTGTLTAALNTESANTVWAGPTTGAAANPTFRALVGADLPNPSSSSLGGVQSIAAVSHEWVNTISTSGVPNLTQPAFTDISGTAAASQLPNPTATTLGGIESYVAVAHQWINTISTSGVPSSTQPGFTDLSGQATLAQLPGIGSDTILSNITGGSVTPLANSLTAVIDAAIGSIQGDVLYRNGSVWTVLGPGTNGQVLTTAGASANPSWTTVTGTGTVTSVATNNGLTGGPITTTGTLGLATITTGNVLANTTGSTAVPTATTPSAVLDTIGSTEGDILYRGASAWSVLAPGTNGQFLQTAGGGSTPSWASAANITGTPAANQVAQWTNATTVQGVNEASLLTAGSGISITGTTTATVAQALTNVTVEGASLSANNSGSTSLTHAGFGSTCKLTPAYSGRFLITFNGAFANGTASDALEYELRYGTGSAPSGGASVTGTLVGTLIAGGGGAGNANVNFPSSILGIVTGLTPGTAYWFDIAYASIVGGTTSISGGSCAGMEF